MIAWKPNFSVEHLRKMLHYSPNSGEFTWLEHRQGRKCKAGGISAHHHGKEAHSICVDYRKYYAHNLAWWWMTGEWPDDEVDHINGNATDNRWSNLRKGTRQQNTWNRRGRKKLMGAYFHKSSGLWKANIQHRTIGYFRTEKEAHKAYKREALKRYGEFAHDSLKEEELRRRPDRP